MTKLFGQLDPDSEHWEDELAPVVMTMVDALLEGDTETLEAAGEPARDALADLDEEAPHAREVVGYVLAILAMTRWGLERLPDRDEVHIVADSHAWKFMQALRGGDPVASGDVRSRLRTSDSQISRVGRQLLAHGLVNQRRAGRTALWELTPRGRQLLEHNSGRRSRAR